MKKPIIVFGHDAIKVAQGTNRYPEMLSEDGLKWVESPIWKCKATADRAPHKVRLRGYASVLLKKANDEARAIIEKAERLQS